MTIGIVSMIRDSWGGSEELWYEMGKIALQRGHSLIRVGYENPITHPKIKELERLGMRHYLRPGWIPSTTSETKKIFYIGWNFFRKKVNSPIKKLFNQKPDVIIYNGTCYSIANETELLKYLQNKKSRLFIIGHLNNEFGRNINEDQAEKIRQAYQLSEKVFFVSQKSLNTSQRQLGITIPNAEIIRNPVNISSLEKIPLSSMENTVQFACVGNLVTAHKGQDVLFEALSKWENKDWVLNIYGSGYDRPYLEKLSKYLQLDAQIFFHGSTSDIRKIWEHNHVLVMPSIMEGMPLALVEAMICGRICIATDVGGTGEWITDEKNGFIAEAPTVPMILNALKRAWDLKSKWQEIGTMAHQTALELYDPNAGLTLLNKITE